MKLSAVVFLALLVSACAQPVTEQQATYVTPIIQSDVSSSGYTPSVIPIVHPRKKAYPLIYPAPNPND